MSQIAVDDEPVQAYEGKVHVGGQFPTTNISRVANELIFFGKYVVPLSTGELTVGDQSVQLPVSAADILLAQQGGGIAIADISVERTRLTGGAANSAPFGAYIAETMLPVMRKGQIWVVVETELLDLSLGVFVRFQNAGGSPPAASLGSFTPVNTADHEPAAEGLAWLAAVTIGAVDFALLSVNLPA